ncbi:MAG: hypothetical protein RMJ66_00065 [Bacteroidia bacterium]|nr:hypothetical protein [Bacteroidia bacterium]MDW8133437.1 hypothetical protein [Bacteroidia bacterium]
MNGMLFVPLPFTMSREENLLWGDLSFSLMRLYNTLQKEEKELAFKYQLGITHVEVLFILSRLSEDGEWIPVKRLYPYLPLTQPAIGRVLRHLSYWRFVEIGKDKSDRRCLLVRLLPSAYALVEEIQSRRAHLLRSALPPLSPKQLRSWVNVLRSTTFARHTHVETSVELPL